MIPARALQFAAGVSAPAILVAFGMISGCEKPAPTSDQTPKESALPTFLDRKTRLPLDRTITDKSGRALDSTIVARTETSLFIVRKPDGLKAEVPLANLSEADKIFAAGLELKEPPADFLQPTKARAAADRSGYVKSREDEIERLTKENHRLAAEVEVSTNQMMAKNRRNTIRNNDVEISKLKAAIQQFKIDNEGR